jgi:hypothetical protein
MNLSLPTKLFATAALAAAGFGVATAAHAGPDVYFSVGVQPATVYTQPRHVYVQPQPVYVQPQPVYVQSQYGNRYDDRRAQRRWERLYGPNGDLDRDGIRNQDDRDRDGDGIRNRHDRLPDDANRY